eukprot:277021-Prymnesium_polylepis.1
MVPVPCPFVDHAMCRCLYICTLYCCNKCERCLRAPMRIAACDANEPWSSVVRRAASPRGDRRAESGDRDERASDSVRDVCVLGCGCCG